MARVGAKEGMASSLRENRSEDMTWLGRRFLDEETQRIVRRVVSASAIVSAGQVSILLVGLIVELRAFRGIFLCVLAGLLLPLFGILGALFSSHRLMCLFWVSNLLLTLCQSGFMVIVCFAIVETNETLRRSCAASCSDLKCGVSNSFCSCEEACMTSEELVCCNDFAQVCATSLFDAGSHVGCSERLRELSATTITCTFVFLLIVGPATGLSAYATFHGICLWRRLASGQHLVHTADGATAGPYIGGAVTGAVSSPSMQLLLPHSDGNADAAVLSLELEPSLEPKYSIIGDEVPVEMAEEGI